MFGSSMTAAPIADTKGEASGIPDAYIPYTDVPPIWNPEFFGNAIS